MKVLICSPYYSTGGISKWTHSIEEYYTDSDGMVGVEIMPMGNTRYLGENAPFVKRIINSTKPYGQFVRQFAVRIQKRRPDIVHICSSGSLGLLRDYLLTRICKLNRVPCVIHIHNGIIPDIWQKKNWEWHLLNIVIKQVSAVVVMTKDSEQTLLNAGIKNVYNVPNPITRLDFNLIDNNRQAYNPNKLVFAGHILPTKGIHELFNLMTNLHEKQLIVIGEDTQGLIPLLKHKYELAFKNNTISFTGQVGRDKLYKQMSSGIFILPSHSEGFPYVILESMACGVPILSTKVGAIPEMLDVQASEPCGICVEPRNSEALLNAVNFLWANSDFAEKIAANAYAKVHAMYSVDKVCNTLTSVWMSTVP